MKIKSCLPVSHGVRLGVALRVCNWWAITYSECGSIAIGLELRSELSKTKL